MNFTENFQRISTLALYLLAAFAANEKARADDNERPPNIVLIMADDLGIEGIGCYGGTSYATPNIDKLSASGLRFNHAHAQPLCTNTRLQLMTGLHNDQNWECFGILPKSSKTIGHYMKSAGYRTCIAGKWQLQSYDPPDYPGSEKRRGTGMHPNDTGFDTYALFHSLHTEDKGSRYADPTWLENGNLKTAKGDYGPDVWVNFINDFMAEKKEEPFCVYFPMALPHWPVMPTPESPEWSDPSKRLIEDPKHFKAMVEHMDMSVGKIVKQIDDLGLRENTLIIFYSDNGTHQDVTSQTKTGPVAGGKGLPTDAGTHVPLVVSQPGKVRVGVSEALVDSTDFIPTILQAAGKPLEKNHKLNGISFYPELVGSETTTPSREWIYCFYDPRPGWDKDQFVRHVSARDRRWKLYENGQLFDIQKDILEKHPILPEADDQTTAAVRRRLAEVLKSQAAPGQAKIELARQPAEPNQKMIGRLLAR